MLALCLLEGLNVDHSLVVEKKEWLPPAAVIVFRLVLLTLREDL